MQKIDVFIKVCELLEDHGHEADLRPEYSGRGMYGATVPAIVTEAPSVMIGILIVQVLVDAGLETWEAAEEAMEMAPKRSDSMGLSKVLY